MGWPRLLALAPLRAEKLSRGAGTGHPGGDPLATGLNRTHGVTIGPDGALNLVP